MNDKKVIVVVGGGAAGFFGAIAAKEAAIKAQKDISVILLEKTAQLLTKVKISGGGRCNVTHSCFDPGQLIKNYPRGSKELLGPFTRFQPLDMIKWLEQRGVVLKTESDGRMFPITDSSETIINCLMTQANQLGVIVKKECGVKECQLVEGEKKGFNLTLSTDETLFCDRLLVATGGNQRSSSFLESLNISFIAAVPSLFTFNLPNSPLNQLAGISVPHAKVSIEGTKWQQVGPVLITHWGLSGPAVLKLSAFAARFLHDVGYKTIIKVDWLPNQNEEDIKEVISSCKREHPAKSIASFCPFELSKNLWKALISLSSLSQETKWAMVSKEMIKSLINQLKDSKFQLDGKTTYKDEFVTSGGVKLDQVNFKTMESKLYKGLYFAGEVLDIDGVTGGFNFQNAWTTSWIAAHAMVEDLT